LLKGVIVYFQLLLSVFAVIKKNRPSIQEDKLFESLKLIIVENESLILEKLEKNSYHDEEIKELLIQYEIPL
jgi:hypothetical protein